MKKFFIFLFSLLATNILNAQIVDANFVVDYSQAIICGMDEESFADYESDWNKDKNEISGGIIEGIIEKIGSSIIFKKSSRNTIKVIVRSITDNGKFNCDIALYDENDKVQAQATNINCSKGGKIGSKLHLMKESTRKEGKKLGAALKAALKSKQTQMVDR